MLPKLIRVRRFKDERGWFYESFNSRRYAKLGITETFVQDNHSFSASRGTLRGLHFQAPPHAQAKLVRCGAGAIWDVAVDIRAESPTRGRWVAATLTAKGGEQLFIPVGFAHGFVTLTDDAEVLYKSSDFYAPESEGAVRWNDPDLAIEWPVHGREPILSGKDEEAPPLSEVPLIFAYDHHPLVHLEEVDA